MIPTPTYVMAVPWDATRARNALDLATAIDAQVIFDATHNPFTTWRHILAALGPDAGIILEDDVQLTRNWRAKIETVIAAHPDTVIQFFSMRKADHTIGSRWEPGRTYLMNQCHYLPNGAAQALHAYSADWPTRHPEHPTAMDTCTAHWLTDTSQKYWLSVPSLVQHRPWKSVISPRSSRRQSTTFTP